MVALVVAGASFVDVAHIIKLEFIKFVEALFAVAKSVKAVSSLRDCLYYQIMNGR